MFTLERDTSLCPKAKSNTYTIYTLLNQGRKTVVTDTITGFNQRNTRRRKMATTRNVRVNYTAILLIYQTIVVLFTTRVS